ncbi:corrinoid protein [Phosphitispora fastidiosa]|uniref:corrinoid protein n=1 Tax=Phosphitispora fastidiosa TaxID=2837202 RepID=UPI001E2CC20F|nr:corrinoid protein [Phosphitispora fastidiosa]MBU7006541.1 5-methyltetrahydrofolate--homocysteine methyltransferase [Phosphitispora fastidiosa]
MENLGPLSNALIEGNRNKVVEMVNEALEQNVDPQKILSEQLIPGMNKVGEMMAEGEFFVPEVLRAAKAMGKALEIIEPLLLAGPKDSAGLVLIGSVSGDIHDIGKNLVSLMLKGSGFEVRDLGVAVSTDKFIDAVKETEGTIILGMSALITPVMPEMPKVIKALEKNGLRDRVKVMVGGATITEEFADSIGADGTASNAGETVALAKRLLNKEE